MSSLIAEPPEAPEIENAGLSFGEIVAHRMWRITAERKLKSGYRDDIWEPGVPVSGDPDHGVHAFKAGDPGISDAVAQYGPNGFMAAMARMTGLLWSGKEASDVCARDIGAAIGTVRLYGTVIEHERGYRAQYAMVESIDRIEDCALDGDEKVALLAELRAAYCPESA